jgi:predicted DNA-binding transcriptional regulator AlpA
MEQSIDNLVELIDNRVADIVWQRIEKSLDNKATDRLMPRKEVMAELDISEATLFRWERTGQLQRAATIGRRVYYNLSDLKQLKN